MHYPLAHRITQPARPYVPASHQTIQSLERTLAAARALHPSPRVVHVVRAA